MSRRVYSAKTLLASVILAAACAASANASVVIDTVPVGNPGNAGEWSGESYGGYYGPDRICGAVDYTYNIAKYEVTAGQYTAFLNAVAGVDTYGLYNTYMWSDNYGCKIDRYTGNGTPRNPYKYRVANDAAGGFWANRPVNFVSYWDSCRFANWLHNGQPTGPQGPGTTEAGAYTLNGYNGDDGREIQRNAGWNWAVTSEDEWYKAAYHKNDGVTGNYWDYPTSSNTAPSNVGSDDYTDPGNHADYYNSDYTIGSPYYRTKVGEFENSASPYGTFDQGGNVFEWNESVVDGGSSGRSARGLRGGAFGYYDYFLLAALRYDAAPMTDGNPYFGFRVSEVPEPATIALLVFGGLGMLRSRRSVRG